MDRGVRQAIVHGLAGSQTRQHAHMMMYQYYFIEPRHFPPHPVPSFSGHTTNHTHFPGSLAL